MKKYIKAIALTAIAIGAVYYFSGSVIYGCDGGRIVNVNLTHDNPDVNPVQLNIPCEYIYRSKYHENLFPTHDGDHKKVTIAFFRDTKKPTKPWYDANPDAKDWPKHEVRLEIRRSTNPTPAQTTKEGSTPYRKLSTNMQHNLAKEFEIYESLNNTYPSGPYELYPKKQRSPLTTISCIHTEVCKIHNARTFYRNLGLSYRIWKEQLSEWQEIEADSKTLINKFTSK